MREPALAMSVLRDGSAAQARGALAGAARGVAGRVPDKLIKDAFRRSLTNQEIAIETGLSQSRVVVRLRELGLSRGGRTYRKVPDEVVRAAWAEGGSQEAIAKAIGVSVPGARMRLRDLGLKPNKSPVIKNDTILEELEAGLSRMDIVRKHGVSTTAVYDRVKELMPEIERRGITVVDKTGRASKSQ